MRSCENCNARLLAGATSCPQCGVYAGEYVEGQALHPRKPRYRLWISWLVVAVIVAAGSFAVLKLQKASDVADLPVRPARREPVRVVRDRPGGAFRAKGAVLSEPEATMLLRRSFTGVDPKCIAILSNGYQNGAYTMTVVNGCDHTRLGQWRVDGKTKAITPASPR